MPQLLHHPRAQYWIKLLAKPFLTRGSDNPVIKCYHLMYNHKYNAHPACVSYWSGPANAVACHGHVQLSAMLQSAKSHLSSILHVLHIAEVDAFCIRNRLFHCSSHSWWYVRQVWKRLHIVSHLSFQKLDLNSIVLQKSCHGLGLLACNPNASTCM